MLSLRVPSIGHLRGDSEPCVSRARLRSLSTTRVLSWRLTGCCGCVGVSEEYNGVDGTLPVRSLDGACLRRSVIVGGFIVGVNDRVGSDLYHIFNSNIRCR